MFKNKKILITGGTGSLGKALTEKLLKMDVNVIRIFSRDELKQIKMQDQLKNKKLRFLIGDVRDKERLTRAMEDIDIVFHTAALKHVPVAEYNPFEAIKTNVLGTQNVIESSLDNNVELVLAIGTDKAVSPLNTYGATKLLMERMITSSNFYKGKHKTKFLCVRYGNVLGSRGSVLPKFLEQIKNKQGLTITDPKMTRFNITMNQAIELILRAVKFGRGGEIFVPKLKAYTVGDLKDTVMKLKNHNMKIQKIPIRQGEKSHEILISQNEIPYTYESKDDYIIIMEGVKKLSSKNFKKVNFSESYSSDKAPLFSKNEIKEIIINEKLL
jgi:UDP-N-acetylglucosamine 4,6-dehydratase/UDP-glucose 4-epimerase